MASGIRVKVYFIKGAPTIRNVIVVDTKAWWTWIRWLFVLGWVLLTSIAAGYGMPGGKEVKGLLAHALDGFSVIAEYGAFAFFLGYVLMVRVNRFLQPAHIKNQVKALVELSKDPGWDANDMGRRLSRLVAWNCTNGAAIVRGMVLAGFSTRALEETALKDGDESFRKLVLSVREKSDGWFWWLAFFIPWVSLLAYALTPWFVKIFSSWTLQGRGIVIGSVLAALGLVPIKLIFELMKPK